MLLSLCLFLKASEDDAQDLPPTLGKAVHASFMGLVHRLDPKMATKLHEVNSERPFTLSLFHRTFPNEGKGKEAGGKQEYWLRVTSLDGELSRLLLELALSPDGLEPLKLLDAEFEIAKVYHSPMEHPWAGQSSFEELYNNGIAITRREGNTHIIGLQFVSPTAFRIVNSRLNMPLPLPHLVFRSLAEKWNAFSPLPLRVNWQEFDRVVTIARHHLETQLLDFGHYAQVGFIGKCWYLIDNKASFQLLHTLQTLAEFAFYAGVGRKTAMGMGQVRRIK